MGQTKWNKIRQDVYRSTDYHCIACGVHKSEAKWPDRLEAHECYTIVSSAEFESFFATKDAEWRSNGVYAYLLEKLLQDGTRFTLVATPNVEASESQIVALAEAFGQEQGLEYLLRIHFTERAGIAVANYLATVATNPCA